MITNQLVCIRSICRAAFACVLVCLTACSAAHEAPHAAIEDAGGADDSQPIVVSAPATDGACSGAACSDAGLQSAPSEASASGLNASAVTPPSDSASPTSELVAADNDAGGVDGGGASACASGSGFTLCGDTCTDVTSDPANCGACGHGCAPGACLGGACQRWVVAKADTSILSLARATIATDGVDVVWLDSAQGVSEAAVVPVAPDAVPIVLSAPTAGTGSSGPQLGQIAMANGVVAWTETDPTLGLETWTALEGQVGSGASTNVTAMVDCTGWGLGLNSTGTAAYFNSECAQGANLLGCNLGGANACSALGITDPSTSTSNGNDVSVGPNDVFVTDSANGALWRYDVPTGTFSQIETGQGDPFLLTVDSSFVYWASQGPNLTFTISRTSQITPASPPQPVVGATGGVVTGIATDGTNVYVSGEVNAGATRVGVVASVPVTGGAQLKHLYASADLPLAIAAAGGVVVWLDGSDFGIYAIRP